MGNDEAAVPSPSGETAAVIDVRQLLSFFDEDATVGPHANAVKAVMGEELGFALLLEYFRRRGVNARMGPQICTTGKATGHRLDGWVIVNRRGSETYYQVEVKTWSQHSLGGRSLAVSATPGEVREFKKERWRWYWSGKTFVQKSLAKVLTPMKRPVEGVIIEPLACLWDAIHPSGGEEPFFTVPIPGGKPFDKVHVFSMSAFLRGLRLDTLELELPAMRERLTWLLKVFPGADLRKRTAAAGRV